MDLNRRLSVIGLGYVGLPLAVAFGKKYDVIGFDTSQKRLDELKNGVDKTAEISTAELEESRIRFTADINDLAAANFHIITVPTPVDDDNNPDLSALINVSEAVGKILKKGDIIVYESTVYPGTTEERCIPILESFSRLTSGKDFFVGYSPERMNPGDKEHTFVKIKKIISAQDKKVLDIIADIYATVVEAGVFRAASIKVAEAAKIIENTQRDLNIALMNELAVLFGHMEIDTHDVLEAARTKWNFLPFVPGLVGGHCIGVDPYYLAYKSVEMGYTPEVILSGRKINDSMGEYIATRIIKTLQKENDVLDKIVVTVLGVTFKENIVDARNSRVVDLIHALKAHSLKVQVYDPHADKDDIKSEYQISLIEPDNLEKADVVVLAVPHDEFVRKGWRLVSELINPNGGSVYDIKSVLDRAHVPENINLFRL